MRGARNTMDKVLISFTTKQNCRSALRLVKDGVSFNYQLSCNANDPAVTIMLMRFKSHIASNDQHYIRAWEKIIEARNSNE